MAHQPTKKPSRGRCKRQCVRGRVSGSGWSEREGDWEWSGRQCARGRVGAGGAGDNAQEGGLLGAGGARDNVREGG